MHSLNFPNELIALIPQLRRFARSLCGDAALADDLVQDCIERALRRQHLYDSERPLRPWLYTILRNIFISGLRRDYRSTVIKTVEELEEYEGATLPDQEDQLSVSLIVEALDLLSPQQREVTVLVGLEEMSYRDVAEIIGIPIGTVMSRLSRARKLLQDILEQRGQTVLRRVK